MQESHSEKDILNRSCNVFTIRGAFCGDKCFPSLNQYIAELGRNPRCGAKYKKQYVMIATNAIRRDMGRFKTDKPVILHYTFAEPRKGAMRDMPCCTKVALRNRFAYLSILSKHNRSLSLEKERSSRNPIYFLQKVKTKQTLH